MKTDNRFYEAAKMMPPFEQLLLAVPRSIASTATEIRVRAGRPVVIENAGERYICGTRCADTEEIYCCIKNFCNYSIHSCQRELSEGWITLKGGHRAGFSGTACMRDGRIETIKDISSLNIRIAREHRGVSDDLFEKTCQTKEFRGLIIAGAPLSGKTTFLRDFCRNCGTHYKTSLVDERGEIAAVYKGIAQNDVGLNTDVLDGYSKREGVEQAIRVLSPQIVICDEIGDEVRLINNLTGSGVKFVFSVHCGSICEARENHVISSLIESCAVNSIAFLDNEKNTGKLKGFWVIEYGKGIDSCCDGNNLLYNRNDSFNNFENARNTIKKIYSNA